MKYDFKSYDSKIIYFSLNAIVTTFHKISTSFTKEVRFKGVRENLVELFQN